MCLQSPNYDIIEHMLSVNKWFLEVVVGGALETADHKVSVGEFTEGRYLELCEKLKFEHNETAKVIEYYTNLMDSTNYEIRLKFTKEHKNLNEFIKDEYIFQELVKF